jgi:membrane protein DedA with SNARE-associated domain
MDSLPSLLLHVHDGLTAAGADHFLHAATLWGQSFGHEIALAGAHAGQGLLETAASAADQVSHLIASAADTATAGDPAPVSDLAAAAPGTEAPAEEAPSGLSMIEPYLQYGPWAILIIFILSGVGLHLSEDLILIPAGFLIAHGKHLDLWETLIAAYCGLVIGDILWIWMCRRFGTRMVQSRWFKRVVHPRRLLEAKHQMEERGIIVVILARFIPGTRTPVITMAGILHMAWWKLLTVEFTTCAITVPLQIGIGYLAGKGLGESKSTGELVVKLVAATAAFILIGFAIHWWVQMRKRAGRAPRSKASWLRTFGRRRREAAVTTQVTP